MRILLVDDDTACLSLMEMVLSEEGFDVVTASNGLEALSYLENEKNQKFDLVITDVQMPYLNGEDLLHEIKKKGIEVEVVLVTAYSSLTAAATAVIEGAFDYLNKPLNVEDLLNTVKRAIKNPQSTLHVTNDNVEGLELIGRSRLMLDLFKTIGKVSPSDSTVFILGESGTGKELIARQIHKLSKRASRPFVAINCGALTESLLEAELFGHQKGAFTGATGDRKGLFMEASGGTIFLDEITETTTVFQMKLLRVLQEGEILPVGSSISRKVDVRVIAATNRNIDTLVQEKQFRTDLLYRLRVITLRLPSLKERQEDIPLLINHFIRKYTPKNSLLPIVSTEALKKLLSHDWPGNVRELEHAIESAVVLRSSSLIKVEDLPENIRRPTTTVSKEQEPTALISLAEVEYRHTKRVLEAMGGNKSQAARILGIDRKTLDRILQRSGSFEKFY